MKKVDSTVFVYRNLRFRDRVVWSMKSVKSGLVVGRKSRVVLQDCRFKVSQAGRARVLRERKKYVHAGVQGVLLAPDAKRITKDFIRATYNPYKYSTFIVEATGEPIHHASLVVINEKGVWVKK